MQDELETLIQRLRAADRLRPASAERLIAAWTKLRDDLPVEIDTLFRPIAQRLTITGRSVSMNAREGKFTAADDDRYVGSRLTLDPVVSYINPQWGPDGPDVDFLLPLQIELETNADLRFECDGERLGAADLQDSYRDQAIRNCLIRYLAKTLG